MPKPSGNQLPASNKIDITPADYQLDIPVSEIINENPPSDENVPMDIVFVGAGPAGLAGAIELAKLVKDDHEKGGNLGDIEIAVLEKAQNIGDHSISGAVVNPKPFKELFPDLNTDDFPFMAPFMTYETFR